MTSQEQHEDIQTSARVLFRKIKLYAPKTPEAEAAFTELHRGFIRVLDTGPCPSCTKIYEKPGHE